MTPHLRRSRIAKALTDRSDGETGFDSAEDRLDKVRVAVVLTGDQAKTAAAQAAALTAVSTSFKCFGSATLVAARGTRLTKPLPIGKTIGVAASALGATLVNTIPDETTHVVMIGGGAIAGANIFVRCWWNGWIAGILPPWDDRALGASGNPLSGVFAGALAVREVFATVLGYPRSGSRVSIASLWEPWLDPESASAGPEEVYIPPRLWLIGLGHLGQGFLWNLGLLPVRGRLAVLQDDQTVSEENEATGLLTTADDVTRRKTRVAARWLDGVGWPTSLIERRHYGDIPLLPDDPPIVITGLDEPKARIAIASTGFEYMIDAGIGHGPVDFESLQIRVLGKATDATALWSSPQVPKDVDALLQRKAYQAHAAKFANCGTRTIANASVAVPFVGAAVGALTITQAIRLASMQNTVQIMQMELGSPGMVMVGAMNDGPATSFGSLAMQLT